jgi:hypothetical protein
MFEHTSNAFIFGAAAAVALILWLDSRTGRPRNLSYAGGGGANDDRAKGAQSTRSIEPAPHPQSAVQPPHQN